METIQRPMLKYVKLVLSVKMGIIVSLNYLYFCVGKTR